MRCWRLKIKVGQVSDFERRTVVEALDGALRGAFLVSPIEVVAAKIGIDDPLVFQDVVIGRLERHGFEYFRHGTLSLYAALDTKTGSVLGYTAKSHTSEEFVSFLEELIASQPESQEVHVILDNVPAHKSK